MRSRTTRQQYNGTTSLGRVFLLAKAMILAFAFAFVLVSCSPHKQLAYDFVKKSKGASVAFYVPEELQRTNKRSDCDPNNIDLVLLDEDELQDTINSRVKILNKIDDGVFFNVMIASYEETLKDYGLILEYWEDENSKPDSLHWVVDLSYVEIQEHSSSQVINCGVEGYYEFLPSTRINVASWFELLDDDNSCLLFTEQNYEDYVIDCYYTLDSINNLIINADIQYVNIDGFYDFAVMLGKLYAGYSFDFFMNEYVKKEMIRKGKEYDDIYMRYDPYEAYIYYTRKDRLIRIEN